MTIQRMHVSKLKQILLGSLLLLSIFCLPSFSEAAQVKSQQAAQIELPMMNLQRDGRSLVYKYASISSKTLQHHAFQRTDFAHILRSYNGVLQTRIKHLAVQSRHFSKLRVYIPARIISQYPEEELIIS